METGHQLVLYKYNRRSGFKIPMPISKVGSARAEEFIVHYMSRIEQDPRFRYVSTKIFIKLLFGLAWLMLFLLILVGNLLSGLICFIILMGVCFYINVRKALKLKRLREEYDLKLLGSDWEFFGCHLSNRFGNRSVCFYGCCPVICPSIAIFAKLKSKIAIEGQMTGQQP